MNNLNKIIFLQSANIPKAVIPINGNIQLLGPNGVGKTTLQKALLFFYNADTMKLGISKPQKPFAQFYYPSPNSMIIYEVVKGELTYCVVTMAEDSQVVYYFVESPYDDNLFIDENGVIYDNWKVMRQKMMDKGIYVSPKVDTYSEFRKIIGGDPSCLRSEVRRFSLMKSSNYPSLAKAIQNVYLGKELSIDLIKDIVISSISESSPRTMDLSIYQENLEKFNALYGELKTWKERKSDAENIVCKYSAYVEKKNSVYLSVKELNYVLKDVENDYPKVNTQIKEKGELKDSLESELAKNKVNYKNQRETLKAKITTGEFFLKQIADKRVEYPQEQVDLWLLKVNAIPSLKEVLKTSNETLALVNKEYDDANKLYESVLSKNQQELKTFKLSKDGEKIKVDENYNETIQALSDKKDTLGDRLREEYDNKVENVQVTLKKIYARKESINNNINNVDKENPYEKDFETIDAEISKEEKKKVEYQTNCKIKEFEEKENRSNFAREEEKYNQCCLDKENTLKKEIEAKEKEINSLQGLLDKASGSFMQWLNENVPGWEDGIGKIVDEESVLYNTNLSPSLVSSDSNTVYGISIDTSSLKKRFRTKKEIEDDIENVKAHIEELRALHLAWLEKKMNVWRETEDEYKAKAVSIKKDISSLNAKIADCEDIMRKLKNAKADFNRKLLDYRNNKINELSVEKSQVEDMIASNERSLKALKESLDAELEKVKNDIAKSRTEALESRNKMLADIEKCIREKEDEIQKTNEEAKAILEKKILDGGCDISIRKRLEEKIQTLNKRLEEADNMSKNLASYYSDKKTFFDKEPSCIKQLSINKEQLGIVEENCKGIISGLKNQIEEVEKELESLKKRVAVINSVRHDYQSLLNMYGDMKYFRCREEEKSSKSASEIINFLNKTIPFIAKSKVNIVQDINYFMIGFPENNSFGFNNEGIGTEEGEARLDYFINKLYEALGVDTEKEREITLSQSFSHVFARISRDVKNLYQHKGHVQKIINELNQDFLKENFVNALKELRFEMEDSDDKLIRLLIKIQSFYDENQSSIGDCGLFSTSDYDMKVVADSISILNTLQKALVNEGRMVLDIKDTFRIKIHIKENENKLDFTDSIPTVSSTGINLLTKAIINIMLINVFKKKIKSSDDVFVHCMIDEVGRLDNVNAAGVLDFANNRKIWIITDAPEPKTLKKYKHTYTLSKDGRGKTHVIRAYSEMP